jgi:hypothetical protein
MFADGAVTTTKMVSIDNGGYITALCRDFIEVIGEEAKTLPPHRSIDHAIDLEPSYNLPYWRISIDRS